MDCSTAVVPVSVAIFDVTLPTAAVILLEPIPTTLARPAELIVATATFEEFHVAVLLRFCVLLSEYVPVAVNCCV